MAVTEKAIMALIESDDKITCNEIAYKLSKNVTTIIRAIQKLKRKGLLSRIGLHKDDSWKILK